MSSTPLLLDKPVLREKHLRKSLTKCQEVGDRDMTPLLWALLGHNAIWQDEPEKAIDCASEAVIILNVVGDDLLSSATLSYRYVGEVY